MRPPEKYIPRSIETEIESVMGSPEIIALIGPRQSGKTTLMNRLAARLDHTDARLIDFEDRDELNLFTNDIKSFAELHLREKKYLFIDEFQYAPEGGKLLKYLYDHYQTKIFITGSSSTELSVQSIQYLVGRILVFHLYPLSFRETLGFVDPGLENLISETLVPGPQIIERVNRHYSNFLIFGGYPRILHTASDREKQIVLENIFNTYLLREINQILGYSEEFKLTKLITALALQVGSNVNYNELGVLTGFGYTELMEALDILEKTFVIARCRPFYSNRRLELVKSPKFFFIDGGFRNVAIKNFIQMSKRADAGVLNENFIAAELVKSGYPLRYWRTKSKAEVDFVVEARGQTIPVEVKTVIKKPAVSRSFRSFLDKYKPPFGIVVSDSAHVGLQIDGVPVEFLPHWAFSKRLSHK